jgi:hypothetical protein
MQPRLLVVSLGLAAGLNTFLLVAACKEKPAATVKEVNKLDAAASTAPNPIDDPRFKEYFDRVRAYIEIHKAADAKVPSLRNTDNPKDVSAREKALADAIRVLRAGAQQGDVFTPGASKEIAAIIVDDFTARPPRDQRAILIEVPMKSPPSINTDYPTKLPLATVPPALLLKLPTLPDDLEYRFLGRHLILRDIKANLIVDFIPDVVPLAPASSKTAGREARP